MNIGPRTHHRSREYTSGEDRMTKHRRVIGSREWVFLRSVERDGTVLIIAYARGDMTTYREYTF